MSKKARKRPSWKKRPRWNPKYFVVERLPGGGLSVWAREIESYLADCFTSEIEASKHMAEQICEIEDKLILHSLVSRVFNGQEVSEEEINRYLYVYRKL